MEASSTVLEPSWASWSDLWASWALGGELREGLRVVWGVATVPKVTRRTPEAPGKPQERPRAPGNPGVRPFKKLQSWLQQQHSSTGVSLGALYFVPSARWRIYERLGSGSCPAQLGLDVLLLLAPRFQSVQPARMAFSLFAPVASHSTAVSFSQALRCLGNSASWM